MRWVGHLSALVFDCQFSGTIQTLDVGDRDRVT